MPELYIIMDVHFYLYMPIMFLVVFCTYVICTNVIFTVE